MRGDRAIAEPTVFIVDDDEAVRGGLALVIRAAGLAVECYASAVEFLERCGPECRGCLVLDLRMPGLDGLGLQEQLAARGVTLPIIFLTGHGDVPAAVRALQGGAMDFIQKPIRGEVLLERIREGLARDARRREEAARRAEVNERLAALTPREREVMRRIVAGQANKVVAAELRISERTVELHRSRIMRKTGARSVAELVRLALSPGPQEEPEGPDPGPAPQG